MLDLAPYTYIVIYVENTHTHTHTHTHTYSEQIRNHSYTRKDTLNAKESSKEQKNKKYMTHRENKKFKLQP